MKYDPIDKQLYIQNREKFAFHMEKNSLAIFQSNDEMPRNGDQNFNFRQNSDLLWLSGIDQEQSIVILFPDSPDPKFKAVLFLRETNEHIAVWEGHKYTRKEAEAASGISTIYWLDDFKSIFHMLMNWADCCYLNTNENDRFVYDVPYRDLRFANDLKYQYPGHTYKRSAPIMKNLRSIKAKFEVAALQTACNITESAFRRVMRFIKPGVWEYEIEAEIMHEFLRSRSTGYAYHPIVASGKSACVLHYIDNNQQCMDGDLILMDFGADYANYAADLTRTIPVNGKFTNRQRDVYNAVLRVMKGATRMLKPGTVWDEYHKEVGLLMEEELIKLGLLDAAKVKQQDPEQPLYKKYFMHGTSHHLGLDVHDLAFRHAPMAVGNVFTVEPGIYIPDENIGIRIENDVLITESGQHDLMASIPREVEEIEEIMQGKLATA